MNKIVYGSSQIAGLLFIIILWTFYGLGVTYTKFVFLSWTINLSLLMVTIYLHLSIWNIEEDLKEDFNTVNNKYITTIEWTLRVIAFIVLLFITTQYPSNKDGLSLFLGGGFVCLYSIYLFWDALLFFTLNRNNCSCIRNKVKKFFLPDFLGLLGAAGLLAMIFIDKGIFKVNDNETKQQIIGVFSSFSSIFLLLPIVSVKENRNIVKLFIQRIKSRTNLK